MLAEEDITEIKFDKALYVTLFEIRNNHYANFQSFHILNKIWHIRWHQSAISNVTLNKISSNIYEKNIKQ